MSTPSRHRRESGPNGQGPDPELLGLALPWPMPCPSSLVSCLWHQQTAASGHRGATEPDREREGRGLGPSAWRLARKDTNQVCTVTMACSPAHVVVCSMETKWWPASHEPSGGLQSGNKLLDCREACRLGTDWWTAGLSRPQGTTLSLDCWSPL